MNEESRIYGKHAWVTPVLLDLQNLGRTQGFGKGLNNSVEVHCTGAFASNNTYNPTTSGSQTIVPGTCLL